MSSYLLPAVTSDALNPQTAPYGITEAMLLSSSVPETPPPAYNAATTYTAGAEVSTGTPGEVIQVWRSLADANTGNAPGSSPTWWAWLGDTYALWAAGTWAEGARVIRVVPGTHAVYQRLAAEPGSSATLPEADAQRWVRVSATNRWAMFDMFSGVPTVAPSPLTVVLAPGRISGGALLDVDGAYADFDLTSASAGGSVFDANESLDGSVLNSWEDYFFEPFAVRSNIVLRDIPTYADGVLTITLTGEAGPVQVGKCIVGTVVPLGKLIESPIVREKSFTVITRQFGVITSINQQRRIPLLQGRLLCPKYQVLAARNALSNAGRAPAVLIGMDNDEDAYADLITFSAVCLDHQIDLKHKTHALLSVEFEGT